MESSLVIPQATLNISNQAEGNDNKWVLAADTITIGRSLCNDIVLPYSWISRRHSMIQKDENNTCTIVDLGSTNGTLVNHKLIHFPATLSSGDIVTLGDTNLTFTQETEPDIPEQGCEFPPDETVVCLQRKIVCILVCDIRSYTALSEQLGVARIGELLQLWCKAMSDIVTKNGGEVDKFIGDAVLAVWKDGDSLSRVIQALTAADEMQRLTAELGNRFTEIQQPLRLWTALNTGEAVVGNIGVAGNRDYTIIGDAVNVAFRLEEQASRLNCDVVIGESCCHHLPEQTNVFRLYTVDIRGKSQPFRCYGCNYEELHRFISDLGTDNG